MFKAVLNIFALVLLSGCGGGSSGNTSPTIPPPAGNRVVWEVTAGNGWQSSTAEAEHFNRTTLNQAFQDGQNLPSLYAMVVVRNGLLVGEAYYHGKTASDLLQTRSVTKTVMMLLIGKAISQGHIQSVEQPITDFLSDDYATLLTDKADIRIRHLLTMTSGISWDESTTAGYNNWVLSADPTRYVLQRMMSSAAGTSFNYNSAAVHLLSVILQKATAMSTSDYAQQELFDPLGISNAGWELLEDGYINGGAGLTISARDLAKIGLLLQQQGRWQQQQLIPANWLQLAASPHSTGRNQLSNLNLTNYGYLWWLGTLSGQQAQLAWGFGGQFILTLPEKNLTLVLLQNHSSGTSTQQQQQGMQLLQQVLTSAL
ncbi:penicillin-binding protein, beta-lactamase class C [Rheinheimera sp. A13L]|uniref:serine hydrolase domain-containing protein n=1 Tax=Rheinheimera sp. A13L TaxID=506534 RepID=UPI0002124A00|nr:serine hydrolase [Rheinheimera sp. A13L]EGM78997.1 penicillin-binding protein, beta-lactamase class C [Rheinheimera sp. A13L]